MEGVWGLPRLREQGRLPGGGNACAESPEVRKILLEKERGNSVSEMGRGGQRPGGLDWRGWERQDQEGSRAHHGRPRMAAGGLAFTLKSRRKARKDCRIQGETELT